jgi:uncharacterized membrane protein YbaN (DUF454 family)
VSHTVRTILGVLLLIMSVIGGLLPVLQGWMFFVAAIAVLGTDHVIVRWGLRRIQRYAWGRRVVEKLGGKFGLPRQDQHAAGPK